MVVGLPGNVQYLLAGLQTGDAHMLTAGVLPDYIYACLDSDRKAVICTGGAMWHDDDGIPSHAVAKVSAPAPSSVRH